MSEIICTEERLHFCITLTLGIDGIFISAFMNFIIQMEIYLIQEDLFIDLDI